MLNEIFAALVVGGFIAAVLQPCARRLRIARRRPRRQ
jgi:predicted PurR-regulated permease PerM